MIQPDPASTCYPAAYREPAGLSRVSVSSGEAHTLDGPRASGIIYWQVEAEQNSSGHLTVLYSCKTEQ